MSLMRVVFINRYFHPDLAATSMLLSDLAFGLCQRDYQVTVVTSRLRYEGGDRLPKRETIQGVDVRRIWSSQRGAGLLGRSLGYGSFYLTAAWCLWRLTRRNDIIVAKTDPPLLSVMAALIAKSKGARLVNWLQDIFPEVAEALNVGGGPAGVVFRLIRPLRNWSLQQACTNVVVGAKMAERVEAEGIHPDRIRIISNWSDHSLVVPIAPTQNKLRKNWGLHDSFVVGYAGNLGRAHDVVTIIEAIAQLQEQANGAPLTDVAHRISFTFVGGGVQLARLEREVLERRFTNVQVHPYQPREHLAETLGVADLHLVSLNPKLEGLIVPSKFYGIAAAGRPTIFIGAVDGEIARLIDQAGCGFAVAPGNARGLADRILQLAGDPELCSRLGARARAAFEERWDKASAVEQWQQYLRSHCSPRSTASEHVVHIGGERARK